MKSGNKERKSKGVNKHHMASMAAWRNGVMAKRLMA
jgi:hypothetical protein